MTKYVVTGQPPDKNGRFAVGPLRTESDGQAAVNTLRGAGWTEVWLLPLDELVSAILLAPGIRP